ncbi:MASE1 domain-containing protein [Streptomyces sp. NPDC095613]|uniref:MASE1 domain-containing protein n=1 Tax=Streptomyces sp. NPDC095613 TaxID=3155540 RepID=UPI0033333B4E
MVRTEESRRAGRLSVALLRILGVTAVYWGAGRLGLLKQVTFGEAVVTPLWPPTGIALAALLRLGPGVWPGVTLGALAFVRTLGPLNTADIGIVAGNTLAPLCALLMLRKVAFRTQLDRLRDGVALVFLGALGGMLVSATVGTASLLLGGRLPADDWWPTWSAWWAGDAMGVLVVTPLLLILPRFRPPWNTRRWPEAVALVVVAAVVTPVAVMSPLSMLYLIFPVLIWAALRFELAGSAPYVLFASVLAISEATDSVGAFEGHTLVERMISLQVLNGSAALTSLLLAAIVTEQANVRLKIQEACDDLAAVVWRLAPKEPGTGPVAGRAPDPASGRAPGWAPGRAPEKPRPGTTSGRSGPEGRRSGAEGNGEEDGSCP